MNTRERESAADVTFTVGMGPGFAVSRSPQWEYGDHALQSILAKQMFLFRVVILQFFSELKSRNDFLITLDLGNHCIPQHFARKLYTSLLVSALGNIQSSQWCCLGKRVAYPNGQDDRGRNAL